MRPIQTMPEGRFTVNGQAPALGSCQRAGSQCLSIVLIQSRYLPVIERRMVPRSSFFWEVQPGGAFLHASDLRRHLQAALLPLVHGGLVRWCANLRSMLASTPSSGNERQRIRIFDFQASPTLVARTLGYDTSAQARQPPGHHEGRSPGCWKRRKHPAGAGEDERPAALRGWLKIVRDCVSSSSEAYLIRHPAGGTPADGPRAHSGRGRAGWPRSASFRTENNQQIPLYRRVPMAIC